MAHPALEAARHTREADFGEEIASPAMLLELADGDGKLFHHALVEAGWIIQIENSRPYKVCPFCGHEFEDEVGFLGDSVGQSEED